MHERLGAEDVGTASGPRQHVFAALQPAVAVEGVHVGGCVVHDAHSASAQYAVLHRADVLREGAWARMVSFTEPRLRAGFIAGPQLKLSSPGASAWWRLSNW
ncbi:hypothetical protein AB0H36_16950 [Kribbella sp. NPDC050820]|uniref:hypothetical protein n=1 Tax=Kribbella sp. NPDC050820 TaxID=3155408 RepID=UPI00340EFF47